MTSVITNKFMIYKYGHLWLLRDDNGVWWFSIRLSRIVIKPGEQLFGGLELNGETVVQEEKSRQIHLIITARELDPYSAICPSCSPVVIPLTPIAPITWSFQTNGTPPSKGIPPGKATSSGRPFFQSVQEYF